jgi:translation initiation factor 3 subunit D
MISHAYWQNRSVNKILICTPPTPKPTARMPSFVLPPIHDNPDGGWGPSTSNIPDQFKFKDIPYAPYSKSDKLGRFADWNDISTDNRQATVGLPTTQTARAAGTTRRREGAQAFGSGAASAFAYFHVEDEASFSLVDNKTTAPRRGSAFTRGRGAMRTGPTYGARGTARGGRGGFTARGGANQRGGRRGYRDWDKVWPICSEYLDF